MNKLLLSIAFIFVFIAVKAQHPQGFFLDDWQPKTVVSPSFINTAQPSDEINATVTVFFKDTIAKVSKYIYGNNAVNWAGKMNNTATLVSKIKKLQPNILRWPGGNLSNEHFWNAVQGGGPADIPSTLTINALNAGMNTTNWAMTVNDYYDLLNKTNSTGCICVNYSYARYGTSENPVAQAAHYAADWVRYDNGRTKLWELGNENFGTWQAGYEINTDLNKDGQPQFISGELYGQHCRVFIDSMKAAAAEIGSDIKIGVNLMDELVTYNDIMNKWNPGVLANVADKADFLIVHSYYTPYNQNSNISTILNSAERTKDFKNYILGDLKTYGNLDNLPIALTEWNIFAVNSMQAVSYINGMHATLVLGEAIKHEYGQANRWDLMNGWSNGNDHGLFASSDEPGMVKGEPHAPYYYLYFFQKYFGDHMVNSVVSGSSVVKSYASAFSSGQSGIVLVNKYTSKRIVKLDVKDMPHAKSYYRYVLTGGTDNGDFSRKVFVNGHGPTLSGGGPSDFDTLEAFGKSISGDIKIELPPLSVTYVLLTEDSIPPPTAIQNLEKASLKFYPNPTKGNITIESPDFHFNKLEIANLNGQIVWQKTNLDNNGMLMNFNLNIQPGIYFINFYLNSEKTTRKLILN